MIRNPQMNLAVAIVAVLGFVASSLAEPQTQTEGKTRTITMDFAKSTGKGSPRIGFLGGLRDDTPDALIGPLHPTLWRIGHQFRGRIAGGLPAAIARVESAGATYKLVMSDLINSQPKDFAVYEADVKKLVGQVGDQAGKVIWEPANEPDVSYKPIAKYYELYAHAFKAVREVAPDAQLCGPSFAFPTYDKYKAFLEYCRENHVECNDLSWHYTGWDPHVPLQGKWQLERLREFIKDYPEQKIREIHCDEWGAGPDKPTPDEPGRLQPGRAVLWFYYLEDVYLVDRACRANWGHADDYLAGIITSRNETYPAYHAYRFYGEMNGMERIAVEGNDRYIAVLACRRPEKPAAESTISAQILVGGIDKTTRPVRLELRNMPPEPLKLEVWMLPNKNLSVPMTEAEIPRLNNVKLDRATGIDVVTLPGVEENQVYCLRLVSRGS